MLEFVLPNALLAVQFGLGCSIGVYAAFGKEVGTPAGDYERGPSIATTWSVQSSRVPMEAGGHGHVAKWTIPKA